MILAQINKASYEYEIHSLVKAFFPSETVVVSNDGHIPGKNAGEPVSARLDIIFSGDEADVSWADSDGSAHRRFLCGRERPAIKAELGRQLYDMLSQRTGMDLPWGLLTGIRPARIPRQLMERGQSPERIEEYMTGECRVSEEKARLAIGVARRERALLSRLDYEDGYSMYIGIPFCPSTCLYCSFTSYPLDAWADRVDDYLDALERELDFTKNIYGSKKLNTIYIGGGTPTTLSPEQMDRLLSMIEERFDLSHLLECSIEAGRPDSITREKLEVIRRHPAADRISVNPQTMKDETLRIIGRHHTVEQALDSFRLAREMGFSNINMDIILGLPGESLDDVKRTMERVIRLAPDNLTVHSLALKRASRLNMRLDEYKDRLMEITPEHGRVTSEGAAAMGMSPYYLYRQKNMVGNFENIGYATPGKEGIYNVLIMEEVQTIVALGAGAITKRVYPDGRIERCDNVKEAAQYIERVDEMIERKRALLSD